VAKKTSKAKGPSGRERGKYDPDRTREAILKSALKLFETQGFHATSVQAVAEDAHVTKGAFYHHFESKEELVQIIHDEFVDHQLEELQRILVEIKDPADQLRAHIAMSVSGVAKYRAHVAVYFQERRYLVGKRFEDVKEKRAEITRLSEGIVQRGIDSGIFRPDIDTRVATLGFIGMSAWVYQWLRASGPIPPSRVADMLADMVLEGLMNR
jgi:TetR/AcrR family transcriptional regulator, cholesterol catabolism regulator